ncbi:MAG: tRNA pseudouridine(38-40) synthase TruA [bacterium]|nr:tRNA pseudouridine(38-40) synthase TruA [bacterium]
MTRPPRRVRIDLSYDGTEFAGFQFQPRHRTVQGVLEQALSRIQGDRPLRVQASGRTDAGVHARRQVAACFLASRYDDRQVAHSLRALLPDDVRVEGVRTVDEGFDPRRGARSKTYRYMLDRTPHGDVFRARFALHYPREMDVEPMKHVLGLLLGRHDFAGFAGSAGNVETTVRTMTEARFVESGRDAAQFVFSANGFLNHMVRILVGALLEVAQGVIAPAELKRILDSGERDLKWTTAPAHGLCLWEVEYEDG